ncbi:hypothetical protein E2C01_076061 [Portunus trituberculatus]|uniref:Uncharacterized protein n=1 Tax=Portunus trituberculatus TaxID=210409 RepID=A0A5B7IGV5_PORTR|nr:hypothetical protein [Portunus trituberculatus]
MKVEGVEELFTWEEKEEENEEEEEENIR